MVNVWLKDNVTKRYVSAKLTGFENRHIDMWYNQWKDNLLRKDGSSYPDARWDWGDIFQSILFDATKKGFCIEYQDKLQGILVVTYKNKKNRDEKPIVFVEYIATAPWNRPDNILAANNKGDFSLVGSYFLKHTVELSQTLGYEGRIALESEPEAKEFYECLGMKNMGVIGVGYIYFEFSENNALAFIKRFEKGVKEMKGADDR